MMRKLLIVLAGALFFSPFWSYAEEISAGKYIAQAADCMACHTGDDGIPYAGGHGLESPIGLIYSVNITPDKTHGIGNYSFEEFDNAVRGGKSKSGHYLYPAMPFVSFQKASEEDMRALYDYFMNEVEPIAKENLDTDIKWPLSMRFPLFFWNKFFGQEETYVYNEQESEEWNRGAYLVQGFGHCGTCHTPRSLTLNEQGVTEDSKDFLMGAELAGWYAPSLRQLSMSDDELFDLLKTGVSDNHAFSGPMADVVSFSLRHLNERDLKSMITYLRGIELKNGQPQLPSVSLRDDVKASGYTIYQEFCSTCHGASGEGEPHVVPKLANKMDHESQRYLNVINVILHGAEGAHQEGEIAYKMPAYADTLSDQEIADLTNYITNNNAWNSNGKMVTKSDVANLRTGFSPISHWWFIFGGGIVVFFILYLLFGRAKKGIK